MLKSRFAGLTHINIHHGAVIPCPSDLLSLADWALGLPVNNLLLINDGGRWSLGLLISGGERWGLGLFFSGGGRWGLGLLISGGGRLGLGLLISGGERWGLGSLFFNIDMVGHALAEIE